MVKPSNKPFRVILTLLATVVIVFCLTLETLVIYDFLKLGNAPSADIFLSIIFVAPVVLFSISLVVLFRQGARYNRRRQAAARGDSTIPIYPQQPIINVQTPTLPITIKLYPTARTRLGLALFSGLVLAGILAEAWQHLFPFQIWPGICGVLYFAFHIWFFTLLTFKWPLVHITLSEEEIQINQFLGEETSIEWEDAHLFSVVAVHRHGDDIRYELSSKHRILRWHWDRSLRGVRPTIPPEEYNRQMEAMLAIIATKTGLTLYDLR